MSAEPTRQVAALPGVREAVEAARVACDSVRWHPGMRRRADAARAESTLRAAQASAALDGADLPLDLLRDMARGVRPAPGDAVGRAAVGALRATIEAGGLGAVRTAPLQALARLHTVAAAGLVAPDRLGRPRQGDTQPADLPGLGPAPVRTALRDRPDGLAALMSAPDDVPALVVAALVHAELLAVRPFMVSNGVVARALFRSVVVRRGLDPTGVAVPEVGFGQIGPAAYGTALLAYLSATPPSVAAWVRLCASAVEVGAAQGRSVMDAVQAGHRPG